MAIQTNDSTRLGLPQGVLTIIATVFAMALTDAIIKLSSSEMTLWQIWILRSAIKDKVLHEKNLFEMLILNTRLPVLFFESRLLSSGAEGLRAGVLVPADDRRQAVTEFDRIRGEVMGLLP